MLIANVLMDENEGLYIDLATIKSRLEAIEEALEPESDFTATLINEIDVGTTKTFKAWSACYYTKAKEVVGKNTTIYLKPEYNYIGSCSGADSSNVLTSGNPWCTDLRFDEASNTYYSNSTVYLNGILFNFTNTSTSPVTILNLASKDTVIFSDGWFSSYDGQIRSSCSNTFYPWSMTETDLSGTSYTRVLNTDIVFYTLNEANTGSEDMSYYLTAPDLTKTYSLVNADMTNSPFSCTLEGTENQKNISTLTINWHSNLSPEALSAIKETTIYEPCLSNITYLSIAVDPTSTSYVYEANMIYYDNTWYKLKDHISYDGYLVENAGTSADSSVTLYKYNEAYSELFSSPSLFVCSTADKFGESFNYNNWAQARINDSIKTTWENESDTGKARNHFVLGQNKYVSGTEFSEYVSNLPDGNTLGNAGVGTVYKTTNATGYVTVEKDRDSASKKIADAVKNFSSTTVVLKDSVKYKGLSGNYTYQNHTFVNLTQEAPTPIYMKGNDGGMYLIGIRYTEYNDEGTVLHHIEYGPCYSTIDYAKASFTPFGTYNRYDSNAWASDNIGLYGAFVRNSSLDTTATLKGVVVVTDSASTLKNYYDSTKVSFTKFTKAATEATVATIIPNITTSSLQ